MTFSFELTPSMWAEAVARTDSWTIRRRFFLVTLVIGAFLVVIFSYGASKFISETGIGAAGWAFLGLCLFAFIVSLYVCIRPAGAATREAMRHNFLDWFDTTRISPFGFNFVKRLEESGATTQVHVILDDDSVTMIRQIPGEDIAVRLSGTWRAVPRVIHSERLTILRGGGWYNRLERSLEDESRHRLRTSGVSTSILLPTEILPPGFDEWVSQRVRNSPRKLFPQVLRRERIMDPDDSLFPRETAW